jgi:hypothetical protein
MEQWRIPINETEIQAFNEGLEIERYRERRDTPAPYIPPTPAQAPEAKQDFEIQPRHVKAVAFLGGGLAIGYSVIAFVAAYAVEIGAVVGVVALVGVVISGLKKSEHGANVRTTSGTTEAKQTTINIHVAADGGKVEVKQ